AVILLLTILLYTYSTYSNFQLFNIGSAILALPYFALGYLFNKNKTLDLFIGKNYLLIIISLILIIPAFYLSQYNGKVRMDQILYGQNIFLFYIIGIAGIFSTLAFSLLFNKFYSKLIHKISVGNLVIMG